MDTRDKIGLGIVAVIIVIIGSFGSREYRKQLKDEKSMHTQTSNVLTATLAELSESKIQLSRLSTSLKETETKLRTSQKGSRTETRSADGSSTITEQWDNKLESSMK